MNAASWIILGVVVLIVGLVIWKLWKDRKAGKTGCDACAQSGNCPAHPSGKDCPGGPQKQ